MRPLRIFLQNFKNHKQTEIDCTKFTKALIIGKRVNNEDISNGVGKTSFYSAIEYALFNQSHETTLDEIVREGTAKAIVEFDFELNNEIYRIYRHRTKTGSADVRLYKKINDTFESLSERTPSATDAKIKELIKISHKAFTYSILVRQADLTGLSSVADPKKRKEILKEPLNLTAYSKLEDLASKKLIPIRKELNQVDGAISTFGNLDENLKLANQEMISTNTGVEKEQSSIAVLQSKIETNQELSNQLKSSLNSNDLSLHDKVRKAEKELAVLSESVNKHNKKLSEYLEKIESTNNYLLTLDYKLSTHTEKLVSLTSETKESIEEIQEQYKKVCTDEIKGKEIIATVKANIKSIQLNIPDSDQCQTCHQEITEEYRLKIQNEIDEKLQKLQTNLESLEKSMVKCLVKKTKLENIVNIERKRITEIATVENNIKLLGNEKVIKQESLESLLLNKTELTKSIEDTKTEINNTQQQLITLKEAINKSNAVEINSQIKDLDNTVNSLKQELSQHNTKVTALTATLGGLQERIELIKTNKETLKTLLVKKEELTNELAIKQMVVEAFSHKGIPTFIIQTILDDLQFEVTQAIKDLRPELDIQLDSDLNIVYYRNGVVRNYEQLSHGQHVYIALAFKRAMSKVIQKRIGLDINMLIFDEVDAHLDDAGVKAFSDAISKWEKDFVIFVITHNKDLKDRFTHAILVEESDDGSEGRLITN
jgi:exonuclease SbcC